MKFGGHAVLFKDKIKTDTEWVISGLAKAGCEGTEIGSRFFGTEDKARLLSILDANKLQMSGMHVGVGFADWLNKTDEVIENVIMPVARFVSDMPNKNIIMSGSHKDTEGLDMAAVARAIDKGAKRCREMGVAINYHNHSGEFEHNGVVFNALADNSTELRFAVDLGWAFHAGYDIIKLLKARKGRIKYVHLRDARSQGSGVKDFCNLGEGIIDYKELLTVLSDVLGPDGWAVVEYEEGEEDMNRYANAMKFLKGFGIR